MGYCHIHIHIGIEGFFRPIDTRELQGFRGAGDGTINMGSVSIIMIRVNQIGIDCFILLPPIG
jgi:hypothetical protein